MNETLGFIGLGHLGLPIALNLLKAGYTLNIYNRTASKAEPLLAQGARLVERPAETLTPGGIVVSVLADDVALEEVVMSEGFLSGLGAGGIHLSMGTFSPDMSRRMAALHEQYGCYYVESPVFGRPEAAAARQLWICLAGQAEAKARVRPLLETLGQGIFDFGEAFGASTIVKLCGNFLIVSAFESMKEALRLAEANGVDPVQVNDMLTQTLFAAPIYQGYGKRIASHTGNDTLGWIAVKDVGLFQGAAQDTAQVPLARFLHTLICAK